MRRREFIVSLTLVATTGAAWAQQPRRVYRIAVVHPTASASDMRETGQHPTLPAFFQELRRLGYVEGDNLTMERYSTEVAPKPGPSECAKPSSPTPT
jgi:putative ABC transport system substrate-binding protein